MVMRPDSIPMPSFKRTWTRGARQLVVQEALDTIKCLVAVVFLFVDAHDDGLHHHSLAGAEMMTFLAPAVRWPLAFSESVNRPVDSMT